MSTGGTARALRDAGLPVTDVAAVTGSPEMLDGRVKTLHPRIHAGLLADRRLEDHRLPAPRRRRSRRSSSSSSTCTRSRRRSSGPGITVDELIEEIDIGGPSMVRAAAKNHANVAIVTSPGQYDDILAALDAGRTASTTGCRRDLALEAFAHTAAYDARIAEALPGPDGRRPACSIRPSDPYPPSLTIGAREGRHAPLRREPAPAGGPLPAPGEHRRRRPVRDRRAAAPGQGAVLQQRPRRVRGRGDRPCPARARRASSSSTRTRAAPPSGRPLLDAWTAALAGDPVCAFGGVVALTRPVDAARRPRRLVSIFLEVVVAPGFDDRPRSRSSPASRTCASSSTPSWPTTVRGPAPDPTGSIRSRRWRGPRHARPTRSPDDPATWTVATRRAPTDAERLDLDLAWRLVRGVTSNAIVLVRDGRLIGMGSGQTSRVDAARGAVAQARAYAGDGRRWPAPRAPRTRSTRSPTRSRSASRRA